MSCVLSFGQLNLSSLMTRFFGAAILKSCKTFEKVCKLMEHAPEVNRRGFEKLQPKDWDHHRDIGACAGYGDDVIAGGHPISIFSPSLGSAGMGFVANKKTLRVHSSNFFFEARATAVFCERVYRGEVSPNGSGDQLLSEFQVPKIRTLSRFLSGGLSASCGVGSLEDAKWCQHHDFERYVRTLNESERDWLKAEFVRTYGQVYTPDGVPAENHSERDVASHASWLSCTPTETTPQLMKIILEAFCSLAMHLFTCVGMFRIVCVDDASASPLECSRANPRCRL